MEGGLRSPPETNRQANDNNDSQAAMEGGLRSPPEMMVRRSEVGGEFAAMEAGYVARRRHPVCLRPQPLIQAAMEGGLRSPPEPPTRPTSHPQPVQPQWRAGYVARRSLTGLGCPINHRIGPQWRAGYVARRSRGNALVRGPPGRSRNGGRAT